MSLCVAKGSPELEISSAELQSLFAALGKLGERRHVLAVPPDLTRRDSRAGDLARYASGLLRKRHRSRRAPHSCLVRGTLFDHLVRRSSDV